jgi:TRAP-type mannitol/chloroaromatic compound transport system substrate-binding protein
MRRKAPALVILALLLPALRPGASAGAEPVRLVTPVVYGTHLPGLGEPASKFAELVEERSGGDLVVELKQPGDGTKPHEILDKVASGSVDAGFSTASYWAAKIPAAALFAGYPFGPDAKSYLAWFEHGNGRKLYQEMYDHAGLKVLVMPCALGGAETGGWFKKEINTSADLKGLRMRIFGLGGRVMARLGATTLIVPGGNLVTAFEKGEIDAAELYPPAVDARYGLKDKVKLIYQPGWHQPETVLELIVNKQRWEALSDRERSLIEGACLASLHATLAESAKLQEEALAEFARSGVKVEPLPGGVLASLRAAWGEVAKEEGDRDYFFQTVLDDIEKFLAKAASTPAPEPKLSADPRAPAGPKATP